MTDRAHRETDAILSRLEHELEEMYGDAFDDIMEQVGDLLNKIYLDDVNPNIPKSQRYNYAKKHGLNDVVSTATAVLLVVNSNAITKINTEMGKIYSKNYSFIQSFVKNRTGKDIAKARVNSDFVYKKFGKHTKRAFKRYKKKGYVSKGILNEIKKGIRNGEGIPKLSRRIRSVSNRNRNSAINTARTEATRFQNYSRLDASFEAEKNAIGLKKRWLATNDSRTRDAHSDADGQTVGLHDKFIVMGEEMDCPGDVDASAGNVCNCRCTMVIVLEE